MMLAVEFSPKYIIATHWRGILAFIGLFFVNAYWLCRYLLIRFAQRGTAALTAFAGREMTAGRLPITFEKPGEH